MKLFLTVFLAVLAAAAVVFTALSAKARLDGWERTKQSCYARIHIELSSAQAGAKADQREMHSMAQSAMDSSDVDRVAELGARSIEAVNASGARILEIESDLKTILEHKPFGLPLTAQERKDLASVRSEIAESTNATPTPPPTARVDIPSPAPAPAPMITLTEPVSIRTDSGTVTLQVGTRLEFVSQINTKVHVHYLNSDFFIPISATDLRRKPSKTAK